MYSFYEKNKRVHLAWDPDETACPLLDPFLQVEGASFSDLILLAIQNVEENGKDQYFAGNVYALHLHEEVTTIEDQLQGEECQLPTPLFIEIFYRWLQELDDLNQVTDLNEDAFD